jgi:hypothetical protein
MVGDEHPPEVLAIGEIHAAAREANVASRFRHREHRHIGGHIGGPVGDKDHAAGGGRSQHAGGHHGVGEGMAAEHGLPAAFGRLEQLVERRPGVERRPAGAGFQEVPVGAAGGLAPLPQAVPQGSERLRPEGLHRG